MKSIREWLSENEMGMSTMGADASAGMDDVQTRGLAMQFRGGVKVNPRIKSILYPALERAMKALGDENPMEILKEILAVSISVIGDTHKTMVTPQIIRQMVDDLESGSSEE